MVGLGHKTLSSLMVPNWLPLPFLLCAHSMIILLFSYDYSNAEIIKLRPGGCIFSYEYLLALVGVQEGLLLLFCWQQSLELLYSWELWILEFPETQGLASPFIHMCVEGRRGTYMKNPEENLSCHSSSSFCLAPEFIFCICCFVFDIFFR